MDLITSILPVKINCNNQSLQAGLPGWSVVICPQAGPNQVSRKSSPFSCEVPPPRPEFPALLSLELSQRLRGPVESGHLAHGRDAQPAWRDSCSVVSGDGGAQSGRGGGGGVADRGVALRATPASLPTSRLIISSSYSLGMRKDLLSTPLHYTTLLLLLGPGRCSSSPSPSPFPIRRRRGQQVAAALRAHAGEREPIL